MTDKPIPKDIPPTDDQIIDSVFDCKKLPPCNNYRINVLRSCADWLEVKSKTTSAINVKWSAMMRTYVIELREIADFIEQCQND